jgi:hypothetical protein
MCVTILLISSHGQRKQNCIALFAFPLQGDEHLLGWCAASWGSAVFIDAEITADVKVDADYIVVSLGFHKFLPEISQIKEKDLRFVQ